MAQPLALFDNFFFIVECVVYHTKINVNFLRSKVNCVKPYN